MAMTIFGDECISCGDCVPLCPTGAISEGGLAFRIDRRKCTECEGSHAAPKCVEVCPIDHCIVRLASSPHRSGPLPQRPTSRGPDPRATVHGTRATTGLPHPSPLPEVEGDQGIRFATFTVSTFK